MSLRGEFRHLDPSQSRVYLIEGADRVLSGFDDDLSDYARQALERLGVTVELGNNVTAIDDDGVEYGGKRIEAETIVWAAGVEAAPVGKWLGIETDKAGRAKVAPDLSVPGHPEIFVVGDAATVKAPDGKPVPGIGDAAKQAGAHAGRVIRARIVGQPDPGPFRYKHLGSLATIGKRAAVIDLGWIKLKGHLAWWVWGLAHIYFLIDTRNRFLVGMSWLWIYLTGRRGARLITQGDAQAIKPLEEIDEPAETAEKV